MLSISHGPELFSRLETVTAGAVREQLEPDPGAGRLSDKGKELETRQHLAF